MLKKIIQFVFALTSLSLFSTLALAQDGAVRLRAAPTISGGQITIGDLFENTGANANKVLARAPSQGQSTVFSAAALQARAASMGVTWRNQEGARQVVVRGAPSERPQFGTANAAPMPSTTVTSAQNATAANVASAPIAVLSRDVARNELITAQMISWIEPSGPLGNDVIIDAEELVGNIAKRQISAQTPVRKSDVAAAFAVRRGQPVTLIHEAGGLRISLRGRALTDGIIGGSIRAVNIATNKPLEAIVEAEGMARVMMPSSSTQVSANTRSQF